MAISRIKRQTLKDSKWQTFRPRIATLVLLGSVVLAVGVCIAWFTGQGRIDHIFTRLNWLQESPPLWLVVPMVAVQYLLAPTVILLFIALVVMKVSPEPRRWSRTIVVGILLALTIRYIAWRSLATLNLADPLNGVFSLGLFGLEMLMLASGIIQLFLMLRMKDRRREADQNAIAVLEGTFIPTVDILVPTYNEPTFILRRTIMGCQAVDYPYKRVYLLDDTRRPEVQKLASELGCEYMTRPDNRYAKAGNLNHAIALTAEAGTYAKSDLIVVFDADFVPTRNFLTRTVGFFQDEQVALVQTPQSFYNPDPIARNLGLEDILTPEEEVFYRQIQPIRDGAGGVICSGTSFVVRRSALEATGGFVTDSLSEDYFTGIRLAAQGYRLLYLDEKLSAGLAADNMSAHATQRLRWARGTLQAFFIEANPLTIPGLSPLQRLAHLEGLLHWFTSISRVGYLIMPLAFSFLGVIPVRATLDELMYFFLPYYVVQLMFFSWLNHHSRSALLSDIYSLVLTFPLALTVIQVMLSPFSKGFNVTPKGTATDRYFFNWNLALPLIVLFLMTAVSLWCNLSMCMVTGWSANVTPELKGLGLGWLWSSYNLIMVGIALLILLDVPRPDANDWFNLRRTVRLCFSPPIDEQREPEAQGCRDTGRESIGSWRDRDRGNASTLVAPSPRSLLLSAPQTHKPLPLILWGVTTMISEAGAEIALTQAGFPTLAPGDTLPVSLEVMEADLKLQGVAVLSGMRDGFPTVRVMFEHLNLQQQRCLVEMLYCRPGQWKRRKTPGEFQSLLLLFRILLKPRIVFDRDHDVRALEVAKG
ncbi:glycosyltransferase [Stenomitos frigidus]|uniref:glycosyltransferase n=1 Tax=Stenomitos frigidus TaxID=1886765 RepID=UPI001C630023|nr:cellulose synthase catalytic subunit [Stenomitos frigidus]